MCNSPSVHHIAGGNLFYKIGARGLKIGALIQIYDHRNKPKAAKDLVPNSKVQTKQKKYNDKAYLEISKGVNIMDMKTGACTILLAFFMKGKDHTTIGASCGTKETKLQAKQDKICVFIHGGAAWPVPPMLPLVQPAVAAANGTSPTLVAVADM